MLGAAAGIESIVPGKWVEPPIPWFCFNASHETRSGAGSPCGCKPITVARREGGSATVTGGGRRVETSEEAGGRGPIPAAICAGAGAR